MVGIDYGVMIVIFRGIVRVFFDCDSFLLLCLRFVGVLVYVKLVLMFFFGVFFDGLLILLKCGFWLWNIMWDIGY